MIYLTYADPYTGVYSSQVSDVCNYLNEHHRAGIRLVAFISVRNFRSQKQKIKKEVPGAVVLPMLPKANYYRCSIPLLALLSLWLGEKTIIARGVLACNVALGVKKTGIIKKVCYDGRGAIAAEWTEYHVSSYKNIKKNIHTLEKKSVLQSDFRIAVSSRLIAYWKEEFGYAAGSHVIIPCTLNSSFRQLQFTEESIRKARSVAGYEPGDVVLVYSGSVAGWQSFNLLNDFLVPLLNKSSHYKVLFLSGSDNNIASLMNRFPQQVKCHWANHHEITRWLSACNYGILIREQSITNKVASPTKFAEYLSAGLPVLISPHIGDYSEFVAEHDCGYVCNGNPLPDLATCTIQKKEQMAHLVSRYFTKQAQDVHYKILLNSISI